MAEVIAQSPRLIVKYQGAVLKECPISKPEFTIGRKPDNDLVIEDASVSGHHAKIVKIHAVYFLEDLRSTNGTLVNGRRVDRKQLGDADVLTVGKHRLVFLEETQRQVANVPALDEGTDQTVSLKSGTFSARPVTGRKVGVVQVISGRTELPEYRLTKALTVIGAESDAFIRLTGLFAPKTVAMIGRRVGGYYVTVMRKTRKVLLNEVVVKGEADLKDGDVLEVAGVKMCFFLKDPA